MTAAPAPPGVVRSVRRKPGKAVFILYRRHDGAVLCLNVDERVAGPVSSGDIPELVHRLEHAAGNEPSAAEASGVSVHALPEDPGLPALPAAWHPTAGDDLCVGLQEMLSIRAERRVNVVDITAIPRHYKPGSRCVIEYRLTVQHPDAASVVTQAVYGKLFAKPAQARDMDASLRLVEAACEDDGAAFPRWSPRSLGVCEPLGMCIVEAAGTNGDLRSGTTVLRPHRAAQAARAPCIPVAELELAAGALVRLHTSSIAAGGLEARSAHYEAERAVERGDLIAAYHPGMSDEIHAAAQRVAASLTEQAAAVSLPCHGSYKRSQLVYPSDGTVTVVDWDSMCAADPALDLGCFLAHLRPAGIWQGRRAARAWFDAASSFWTDAYARGMTARGVPHDVVAGIVGRSAAYEAATLLKMATRRLRRLQSPRPQELRATLAAASCCLAADAAA
ncbi:MAG: phosphotransferase [Candidatus Dormibacteraeota bacterium]|nr:phosphotransferase [Candidatus Dormibacteraeota bacterium]MBV9526580.1 phosphotransferase [Candidatus Dormibacteraeota bacterium]